MNKTFVELFAGSCNMSKHFQDAGYDVVAIEKDLNTTTRCFIDNSDVRVGDVMEIEKLSGYGIIWASPPCDTFSVASIGTHWEGGRGAYKPKTQKCKDAIKLLNHTIKLIAESDCKYWYIENPRGVMRKVIDQIFKKHGVKNVIRHTLTYCQYGDNRMKPTDIWTNNNNWSPRKMCKNGDPCHIPAPRGSKTGTQGLKDAYERGIIPNKLCEEIVKVSDFVL